MSYKTIRLLGARAQPLMTPNRPHTLSPGSNNTATMKAATLLWLVTYLLPATTCLTDYERHHLNGGRPRRRSLY